jgi:hypothetical protein
MLCERSRFEAVPTDDSGSHWLEPVRCERSRFEAIPTDDSGSGMTRITRLSAHEHTRDPNFYLPLSVPR